MVFKKHTAMLPVMLQSLVGLGDKLLTIADTDIYLRLRKIAPHLTTEMFWTKLKGHKLCTVYGPTINSVKLGYFERKCRGLALKTGA